MVAKSRQALAKGTRNDISMGPVTNRRCTDILFLMLFLGSIGVYLGVISLAYSGGDINRYAFFMEIVHVCCILGY